jgi:hypothetical protein
MEALGSRLYNNGFEATQHTPLGVSGAALNGAAPAQNTDGLAKGHGFAPDMYTRYPELIELADYVALEIVQSGIQEFRHQNVMGAVRSTGKFLQGGEKNEFFALLVSHPNVTPLESGNFAPSEESEFIPRTDTFWESPLLHAQVNDGEEKSKSLTPSQISRVAKAIEYSRDFRRMSEKMRRRANPRRRANKQPSPASQFGYTTGKYAKRMQGRHNTTHVASD